MLNPRPPTDFATGHCKCTSQFASSDGTFNVGRTGDCGYLNALNGLGVNRLPRQLNISSGGSNLLRG